MTKIRSPAVKKDGKVTEVKSHPHRVGEKDGFTTTGGKFVNREDAGKIARKAGQVKPHPKSSSLHSSNLKKGKK